jgi:hypothetical protein
MKKLRSSVPLVIFIFANLFFKEGKCQQWDGKTLLAVLSQTNAILIDTNGITVHTYTGTTGDVNRYTAVMIPGSNGSIYRTCGTQYTINPQHGGMYAKIQRLDYNSNVTWEWSCNTPTSCLHHDLVPMQNGHLLVSVAEVKSKATVEAAIGTTLITGNANFLIERILEIEPVGTNSANIVWQWTMWDHLIQTYSVGGPNYYPSLSAHPELFNVPSSQTHFDLVHMNGMDYNPMLDQISFSSPLRQEWYIIDHSTTTAEAASHSGGKSGRGGDLLYRWGKPSNYGVPSATTILYYNHDAHWIKEDCPDANMLSGFCNGCGSTVDHVFTPRVGFNYTIVPGAAYTPTSYTSRYVCGGGGGGWGNSEQFPNGNQMINVASSGAVIEVTQQGAITWTYQTQGGWSAQAHRYPPCFFTASVPVTPSITVNNNSLVATGAASYQWYFNGGAIPNATNQALFCPFGQNGFYQVRTKDANGCIPVYSSHFNFTPPAPTYAAGRTDVLNNVSLYPNPTREKLYLSNKMNLIIDRIEIYSAGGTLVKTVYYSNEIDLSAQSSGFYFARIYSGQVFKVQKLSLLR